MNKVYEYTESILGKDLVIGETDCNWIAANYMWLYHGIEEPLAYLQGVKDNPRDYLRRSRAVEQAVNAGFVPIADHPKEGDFIILERRFWDECAFVLNSTQAVTCVGVDELGNKIRKVRTVHPSQVLGIVYRKI